VLTFGVRCAEDAAAREGRDTDEDAVNDRDAGAGDGDSNDGLLVSTLRVVDTGTMVAARCCDDVLITARPREAEGAVSNPPPVNGAGLPTFSRCPIAWLLLSGVDNEPAVFSRCGVLSSTLLSPYSKTGLAERAPAFADKLANAPMDAIKLVECDVCPARVSASAVDVPRCTPDVIRPGTAACAPPLASADTPDAAVVVLDKDDLEKPGSLVCLGIGYRAATCGLPGTAMVHADWEDD